MKAIETQIGGKHYGDMGVQPLEATLANFGYEGLRASVYTKVLKYLTRDKGSHIEDIKKAIHCLEIQLEAAQDESKANDSEWEAVLSDKPQEDSEGWIVNTGVDPEQEEGSYDLKFKNCENYGKAWYDSSVWDWGLNIPNPITHYRIIKNTGDNKVDG